jgi:hypothetical protein
VVGESDAMTSGASDQATVRISGIDDEGSGRVWERDDLRAEDLGDHAGDALGVVGRDGEVVDPHGRFSFCFFFVVFDWRVLGFVGRSVRGVSRAALTAPTSTSIAHAAA